MSGPWSNPGPDFFCDFGDSALIAEALFSAL
jgi:hypothetical protein